MIYLISLVMLIATFLVYRRTFDIFTDKGSIRKLVSSKSLHTIILALMLVQFFFSSIIFYVFWSFFNIQPSLDKIVLATSLSIALYSTSFIIYKRYGPYVMFSFDARNRQRARNVIFITAWLLLISFVEGVVFSELYPLWLPYSTFISGFAITVIAFLTT